MTHKTLFKNMTIEDLEVLLHNCSILEEFETLAPSSHNDSDSSVLDEDDLDAVAGGVNSSDADAPKSPELKLPPQ